MTYDVLSRLEPADWLEANATLQAKKNALRADLRDRGVLKKGAENKFDRYTYFSEAQYKSLFTELFSNHKLELKFTELEYNTFDGPEKQANGRMPRIEFTLIDVETGFFETTVITGEGIDKGDKAGYKAYTGALKYYLADTFMVATGDDPEQDSPDEKMNTKRTAKQPAKQPASASIYATPEQIARIRELVKDIPAMLGFYKIERIEDLRADQAEKLIATKERKNNG